MSAGWEPPACKSSCFSCEPKNLNHGRRAKALPITIAKTPYQCKTGAGAKRHQYNNRAGTSTKHRQHEQRQKAVALANDARARVFLPAQRRTEVMGNAPAHPNSARRAASGKEGKSNRRTGEPPRKKTPQELMMSTPSRDAPIERASSPGFPFPQLLTLRCRPGRR